MLSKVLLSLWLVAHSLADSTASFQPRRLAFASLQPGDEMTGSLLLDALVTDGLISITDIPDIDDSKKSVLSLLHPCVEASSETKTHQFADGTRRRTLASHTIPGPGGQQPMSHNSDSKVCHDFATASTSFRSTVGVVTQLLADRMAETLAVNITEGPLLTTASNHAFQSLREVVHGGEHLEHFHCYQKTNASAAEDTIDLHTDQGLFLVFTPGQMVSHDNKNALSSGFFVETVDGSIAEVEFTSEDDLVILLGDGVNQYINARLPSHQQLRALPHSLRMPTHQADEARVWYGRMVLPPSDAIHPAHGLAFGELRERLIDATYDQDESKSMALGCSGSRIARELHEDVTCAENALYCWHQCMDFADYNVTEASCQAQDLQLSCINPRLQISNGTLHGDYYPGCVSADAEMETPIPILPDYPRDEETCTKQGFYEFAAASGYNNTVVLLEDVAIFQYNLVQEQGSALLEGRLAFNGLFGWLGFGFANVTGALNGMLGARVIMAYPGGNYTGFSGLDLSLESSIAEYHIDPEKTTFRVWTSTESSLFSENNATGGGSEAGDCYSAMHFFADNIKNQTFNFEGTDDMLWAANGEDSYMMYHGANRGRFKIDWATGEVTSLSNPPFSDEGHDGSPTAAPEGAASASPRLMSLSWLAAVLIGAMGTLMMG